MKNKQELAQALSENLDRVNEGMLQQAIETDTAEKFHALSSKPKTVRFSQKEQSVTTTRKIAAIAACLAVALSITVGGISLARHLPGIFGTTPTDPPLTQPPGTTQTEPTTNPTEPTEPTEPTVPSTTVPEPDEPLARTITITSGSNSITNGTHCLLWISYYDGSWKTITGNGAYGYLSNSLTSNLGTLWRDGNVQVHLSDDGTLNGINVYYMDANKQPVLLEDFPGTAEALSDLPTGTWCVAFNVTWRGDYVESEGAYEQHCYDHLFILEVLEEDIVTGTVGVSDLHWELNAVTGVMTISGNGSMSIEITETYPWNSYKHLIQHVIIEEGVHEVADHAFSTCENLQSVTLADSIWKIEDYAFVNCTQLTDIVLPAHLYQIGYFAFSNCVSLTSITFPSSLSILNEFAFLDCTNLTSITFRGSSPSIDSTAFMNVTATVRYPGKDLSWEDDISDYSGTLAWEPIYCEDQHTIVELPGMAPACETEGFTESSYCNVCGEILSYAEPIPALEHIWGEWVVVQEPTVQKEGLKEKSCSLCNSKISQMIAKLPDPNPDYTESGSCGDNVTWVLDTTTGILTISGTGAMKDYAFASGNQTQLTPWRKYKDQIVSVVVEEGITHLGSNAFVSFTEMTQLTLPSTLSSIGDAAFYKCSKLTNVTLPESVCTVGTSLFYGCASLQSITLPEGLTSISGQMFAWCTHLESISIPSSVEVIGVQAFQYCTALTEISIPSSVLQIESKAFDGCQTLQKITLSEGLQFMSSEVFSGCYQLSSITVPSTVTTLTHTFESAYALKTIKFLGNSPECGSNLFGGVTATVYYPSNNLTWTERYRQDYAGQITWMPYESSITPDPIIASGTCGDGITWTLRDAYTLIISGNGTLYERYISWDEYQTRIEKVVISEGIISIGARMFNDYHALSEITIANSVQRIEDSAFANCLALLHIEIPESVTYIGNGAFSGCTNLQSITFTGNVPEINVLAFWNITATVYYPADNSAWTEEVRKQYGGTLTWVPVSASHGGQCGENTTWVLDDGVLTISGTGAVTDIAWLSYRDQITKVVVEDGVTALCTQAFSSCIKLTEVIIADSVTDIGTMTFWGCSALTHVKLSENLSKIGKDTFNDCTSLQQLVIPEGVTTIGEWAFGGCEALTKITLPQSLTTIEKSAFNGCSALPEISFPEQVVSIGDYAFNNCTSLKELHFHGDPPAIEYYTFNKVNASAYYPAGNEKWERNGLGNKTGNIILYPQGDSGICGDDLTWSYAGGVLTISGTGQMYEYSNRNVPPWRQYAAEITQLILPEGLTNISRSAFVGFVNITSLEIPNTVTAIGSQAFSECTGLTSIIIPDSVQTIASMAFNACRNLQTVTIGKGIQLIEMSAFMQCGNLQEVHFLGDMPEMSEAFLYMTLTIYYPAENTTWDPEILAGFGKSITWVPVEMTP